LLGVVVLAQRASYGSCPWVIVAWALLPVVATRIAATASGDIAVADTVLGLVVAVQASSCARVRSWPGACCAPASRPASGSP